DYLKAISHLEQAANQQYPPAYLYLGLCYNQDPQLQLKEKLKIDSWKIKAAASIEWFKVQANTGSPKPQLQLAQLYSGVLKDEKQATYWYQKAAEQGNANAQFNLGVCYAKGTGISKDAKQAVYWYWKAAEQGEVKSQMNLGVCYTNGTGVPKDDKHAFY